MYKSLSSSQRKIEAGCKSIFLLINKSNLSKNNAYWSGKLVNIRISGELLKKNIA